VNRFPILLAALAIFATKNANAAAPSGSHDNIANEFMRTMVSQTIIPQ